MRVSQLVINKRVVTIKGSESIQEFIKKLNDFKIGAIVVSENGSDIQGIISERDIVRNYAENQDLESRKVFELMTSDVQVCRMNDSVASVMQNMTEGRFRHCPVVNDDNQLISIISIGDVVKAYISEIASERDALNTYINS